MEVDFVFVGAGVASLSAVLRLFRRLPPGASKPHVVVLEKGASVGAHVLSGAIVDDDPLGDLLTETERREMPVESVVVREGMYRLTKKHALRLPWVPPMMRARGFPLVSLMKFTQYLAKLCEKAGAEIYTGFAAAELIEAGGRVTGVRVGDKGVAKDGTRKPNFEPGPHVHAKVVVLGEGADGILTEHLVARRGMGGPNRQTYAVGVKELIELPADPARKGTAFHTFGWPQDYYTYGGGFLYGLNDTQVAVGLVTALDYRDPMLNPHDLFRAFKAHPFVAKHIAGGRVVGYGAKMLPEGGYFAAPKLVSDGVMIVGDSAGLLDTLRLKGIHIAIQSGIAAGDALVECWSRNDFSVPALEAYPAKFHNSSGWRQMKQVRNVRAAFALGTIPGLMAAGLSWVTGGRLPPGRLTMKPDHETLRPVSPKSRAVAAPPTDSALQMDRLSDLYHSGTRHEEDQPPHLRIPDPAICREKCIPAYDAPCTRFCPAQVYTRTEDGMGIRIDFANCLHCGTCEVKDPFRNIEWHLPEGDGGPRYQGM